MVVYVPLVWIRQMEKLAFTHLIADVIILTTMLTIIIEAGLHVAPFAMHVPLA